MRPVMAWSAGFALVAAVSALLLGARPAVAAGRTVTPSTRTVQAGDQITLAGVGFWKCASVNNLSVTWDGMPVPQVTASLSGDGNFTVLVLAPQGALGLSPVTASCPGGNSGSTFVDEVNLTSASQVVQAGQMVTITGAGFTPCLSSASNTDIALSVNGTTEWLADPGGAFQERLPIPASAPGGRDPVTAQCADAAAGDPASTDLFVVSLALSAGSVRQGEQMTVTGEGYLTCRQVQLQLDQAGAPPRTLASSVGLADGSFSSQVTVPASAPPGGYSVGAWCLADAGTTTEVASAQVAVLAGSSGSASPTSASPTPTSPSAAGHIPHSVTPTPRPDSSSSPGTTAPHRHVSHQAWSPVALAGGAGVVLSLLVLAGRTVSTALTRRGRGWARKHLRTVARADEKAQPNVQRAPGSVPLTLGLEPHHDDLGTRKLEVTQR